MKGYKRFGWSKKPEQHEEQVTNMDRISIEKRSANMSKIRSKDTKPEVSLRKSLFSLGYRYRVNYRIQNALVDIAFPRKKKAINIHGCFWHQHEGCKEASKPKTNVERWERKFAINKARDLRTANMISENGWELLIVWECELESNKKAIVEKIVKYLVTD